jgi:hypothetical protein
MLARGVGAAASDRRVLHGHRLATENGKPAWLTALSN